MVLIRKIVLAVSVASLPLLAGCSSSSTTTPPAVKYTYYSIHSGGAGVPQVGVLPNPLLSTSTLITTVNNNATNGLLSSRAMVFDSAGRMFILNGSVSPSLIQVFTTLPLTNSSVPAFTLTLPAAFTGQTYAIAFDSAGNLWA